MAASPSPRRLRAETLETARAPIRRRRAAPLLLRLSPSRIQKHLILPFIFCTYVAVGCEIDNDKMELLLSQLSGKDITELIAAGREKFASVPCGGGGVAVAAAAPAAGGGAPAAEAKKEEKVEEKEESDDDMGFSLFD
ncbi:hypothetical protein BAE44_0001307 [Dichanthelium oligosanthes]|uniref:60S acidic ribosomal protein P2A n=1 Tax=Dichanthelium oligosanthes TaxID=888268 RepID=A0A1E5WK14_9POAL|nr:hypothetical protein BAE44_0001307 [Dichanthelium oligosanthes]